MRLHKDFLPLQQCLRTRYHYFTMVIIYMHLHLRWRKSILFDREAVARSWRHFLPENSHITNRLLITSTGDVSHKAHYSRSHAQCWRHHLWNPGWHRTLRGVVVHNPEGRVISRTSAFVGDKLPTRSGGGTCAFSPFKNTVNEPPPHLATQWKSISAAAAAAGTTGSQCRPFRLEPNKWKRRRTGAKEPEWSVHFTWLATEDDDVSNNSISLIAT